MDRRLSPYQGYIELICGCMFSGKSKMLISRLKQAQERGMSVIAFKHASDDRYSTLHVSTHDNEKFEAHPLRSPARILAHAETVDCIAVDEVQFFRPKLADIARQCADRGKLVFLAGLDLDSWGLPFGPMPVIEASADTITRLQGVCAVCGHPATHTQRTTPVKKRMTGGKGDYEPRCKAHFVPPPMELRR
jgi:thymidine kinase